MKIVLLHGIINEKRNSGSTISPMVILSPDEQLWMIREMYLFDGMLNSSDIAELLSFVGQLSMCEVDRKDSLDESKPHKYRQSAMVTYAINLERCLKKLREDKKMSSAGIIPILQKVEKQLELSILPK